jgi:hypothetical protein
MTDPCINTAVEPKAMPEEVLQSLAALLGANFLKEESGTSLHSNCNLQWSSVPWEPCASVTESDQDSLDVNFSSFPSLSLDRSEDEHLDSPTETKRDVEAHVSALLSRPILVSSAQDVPMTEDEEGETMDFVAEKVSEVPSLMLQNLSLSFTTLMNSRLRAYATFLARHGLSLLATSSAPDCETEEGVVGGVEQKLGTILEIGRLVSSNAIVTAFHATKEGATRKETMEDTSEVSMPLVMDAAIDISLPRPWGGQSEVLTVSLQTVGTITGIFSPSTGNSLLRVVGVDLDMSKLLQCMIEQAESVISCIVEMTNAAFSLSLPPSLDEAQGVTSSNNQDTSPSPKRKARSHVVEPVSAVVSPSLRPTESEMDCIHGFCLDQGEGNELSPEKTASIVDLVLYGAPGSILSPPTKKRKIVSVEGAGALPTIS